MLNRVAFLVALTALPATLAAQPAQQGRPRDAPAMSDTVPFGNRFGFPFTRAELKRAALHLRPEEEAECFVRLVYEPDDEVIGIALSDVDLLLLAALSEDAAERVIRYAPRLRERVAEVRRDPERFLSLFRRPES